jgi:hypothetical protein
VPWIVVDPRYSAQSGVKVVRCKVPYFPDDIDYEGILGNAFQGDDVREWRDQVGLIILATELGYGELEKLMDGPVDVTELSVREETKKLALERQAVVLRWVVTQ